MPHPQERLLNRFSRVIYQNTWFRNTDALLGVALLNSNFLPLLPPKNPYFGGSPATDFRNRRKINVSGFSQSMAQKTRFGEYFNKN